MSTLADAMESLAQRGRLRVTDPPRAAEHLAFLVLGAALDRAMFDGRESTPAADTLTRAADDLGWMWTWSSPRSRFARTGRFVPLAGWRPHQKRWGRV
jgi:hypothetical protein